MEKILICKDDKKIDDCNIKKKDKALINQIEIYKLKTYNTFECDRHKYLKIGEVADIIKLLNKDINANEYLLADSFVKCFFDIEVDGLEIDIIQNFLLNFFNNILNIKIKGAPVVINDIKYTRNDLKFNGPGSYHIVIPKLYSIKKDLKNLVVEMMKTAPFKFDDCIYKDLMFRLPNQTGSSSKEIIKQVYLQISNNCISHKKKWQTTIKYKHLIINGSMSNFILQNPDLSNSINLQVAFNKYLDITYKKNIIEPIIKIKQNTKNIIMSHTVQDNKTQLTHNGQPIDLLLNCLTIEFLDNYDKWIQLGALLFSIGETVEKWIIYSKKSIKYNDADCAIKWATFRSKKINIATLHYWVKTETPDLYKSLNLKYVFEFDRPLITPSIINKSFLTTINKKNQLNIDPELIPFFDDLFITNKYKSLSLKSPYGTSKTQLLKSVIAKYNPKKILWLSFRLSLTDDLMHEFSDLGFNSYLDKNIKYDTDRLIIQIESLLKIQNTNLIEFDDDGESETMITPEYDLIMLDEIESILRQFSSQNTFNGKSQEVFNYLEALMHKSKNIISLDGDMDNRSYSFLKSFKRGCYIENVELKNNKILTIQPDINEYETEIFNLLDNNKKIVICSMHSELARYYNDLLHFKYPALKIECYTGISDGVKKQDLKKVKEKWGELDVLIYTPTIEAGVSFDTQKHFYKIFGIICAGSCSQLSFYQMLARVRNPENKNITVLSANLQKDKIIKGSLSIDINNNFFKFEEVKSALMSGKKLIATYNADGNYKIGLDNYAINTIYNKVEELNKTNALFISYLIKLGERKGYNFCYGIPTICNAQIKLMKDVRKAFLTNRDGKINKIFNSDNITNKELNELTRKQQTRETTERENYIINKKILENTLGLILDEDLIKKFNNKTSSIKNFSYLIDGENFLMELEHKQNYKKDFTMANLSPLIIQKDDAFIESTKIKLKLVNNFLDMLNLNCYSTKIFTAAELENIVKDELEIFEPSNQILMNKSKTLLKYFTPTQRINYINSILLNYNLIFTPQYNKKNIDSYTFERLNNIDEIIYYKHLKKPLIDKFERIKEPREKKFYDNYLLFNMRQQIKN